MLSSMKSNQTQSHYWPKVVEKGRQIQLQQQQSQGDQTVIQLLKPLRRPERQQSMGI